MLRIHPLAASDAERIANYIAQHSVQGMLNWIGAYEHAQARISESPLAYSAIPDKVNSRNVCYQFLFKTKFGYRYRVIYLVDGGTVLILRVRGKGQNLLDHKDLPNG